MGRTNIPQLSEAQKQALYEGFKTGKSHCFRMRCHSVLLKSEGRTSKEVGSLTDMCHISVNSWLKRYLEEGISGLFTKKGRGRKPMLTKEVDETLVLELVKSNRQRIQVAKAEWEAERNNSISSATFRRFLKSLVEDINV